MAKKPPGKKALSVLETTLSLDEISSALRLTGTEAMSKFQDARVTSWFAEIWGERLFQYKTHINSNHPGSDAALAIGHLGKFDISVRCFNRGNIKFQKSKDIGSGRGTDKAGVIEALESVERVVIVDLRSFPLLKFFPTDSRDLLKLTQIEGKGSLGVSGLTPKRFDDWIIATFDVTVVPFDLPTGKDLENPG